MYIHWENKKTSVCSFTARKNNQKLILQDGCFETGREKGEGGNSGFCLFIFPTPLWFLRGIRCYSFCFFSFFAKRQQRTAGTMEAAAAVGGGVCHQFYVWWFHLVLAVPFVLFYIKFSNRERNGQQQLVENRYPVGRERRAEESGGESRGNREGGTEREQTYKQRVCVCV